MVATALVIKPYGAKFQRAKMKTTSSTLMHNSSLELMDVYLNLRQWSYRVVSIYYEVTFIKKEEFYNLNELKVNIFNVTLGIKLPTYPLYNIPVLLL